MTRAGAASVGISSDDRLEHVGPPRGEPLTLTGRLRYSHVS